MTGPVACARPGCGHDHRDHAPGGAHCTVCECRGFQWVDPAGASGSYSSPPSRVADRRA